jgi:hypothetical protein
MVRRCNWDLSDIHPGALRRPDVMIFEAVAAESFYVGGEFGPGLTALALMRSSFCLLLLLVRPAE